MANNQKTPNRQQDGKFTNEQKPSQNRTASEQKSSNSMGRGWHGDSEGHARAGSQSAKNK